jgi:hypothetical protein
MAQRLEIDDANKLVRLSLEGVETDQDLLAAQDALRSCWEHCGPWNCIVDSTGVTDIPFLSETVRTVAYRPPVVSVDCLLVIVAPTEAEFGLARMFELLSQDTRPNVRVVHSMEEALDMVEVKSPNFLPIVEPPHLATRH